MVKLMLKTKCGKVIPVTFKKSKYRENNNLYIGIISWEHGYPEPWGDLTVNLSIKCDADCAFLDTNNNGEEVLKWAIVNNLGVATGRLAKSGFCLYPEIKFNKEFLEQIEEY